MGRKLPVYYSPEEAQTPVEHAPTRRDRLILRIGLLASASKSALREKLQAEKPSLEGLIRDGACDPDAVMTMEMYFDVQRALHWRPNWAGLRNKPSNPETHEKDRQRRCALANELAAALT